MESQSPIIQPAQPEQKKGKGAFVLIVILVAILAAGGAGGGVYYYMDQQAKTTKNSTDSQIESLEKQVSDLNDAVNWQTYKNTIYGFSFKYPTGWTIAEQKVNSGDARQYEISFGDQGYYVTVFNMGSQNAKAFVNSFYSGVEGGPTNIQDVTVNNNPAVKFFVQHGSSTGQVVGSTNYFFSKNATGVDVSNSMKAEDSDTTLTDIVNSFEFL